MGNTGSPSLSIVAIHETAELGNNPSTYPVAYDTLKKNSYVDNVCRVAPDVDTRISRKLKRFHPWVVFITKSG